MIRITSFLTLFALAALDPLTVVAQGNASEKEQPAATLQVGDAAPALKVDKWLRGEPVTKFEPGNVYVVEFWATWCGALHNFMPQLTELQARYKNQGVTIIAFTSRDIRGVSGNTEQDVAAFLAKQRPAPGYAFAYADDGSMVDAWLEAAGEPNFCTFVVDKKGCIAYMGHPMLLDWVLPKVTSGASAKTVGELAAKVAAEYETTFETLVRDFQAGRDPKPSLDALMKFEARNPSLTDLLPVVQAKLSLLPQHGKPGEAEEYAAAIVTKGIKQKNPPLLKLAYSILRNEQESRKSLALAVRAAEACVHLDGGTNARSLLDLADAHLVSGDKAKAQKFARQAIEVAGGDPPTLRQEIEKAARRLGVKQ